MQKQQPIPSGFGAASTAGEVIKGIDLSGKTAIVTGGYAGIGLETTRVLTAAGAKVIVPVRDMAKAEQALKGIAGVEMHQMDLFDPASIDAFAAAFLSTGRPLHILVNNAGIMATPLVRDVRGYESQFATNHLGHFQLVARLWPALVKAGGARVVSVSSWGHRFSPVDFDDPNFLHRPYDRWLAYGQSKTANVLFAVKLDEVGKAAGIRAFSLHPGTIVGTDLSRHISLDDLRRAGALDENDQPILDPSRGLKTVEQGAATSVWCATSPQLEGRGGVYCENCDIAPLIPADKEEEMHKISRPIGSQALGVFSYAVDPVAADRLWKLSETLTAVKALG
ncbi:oxidoreductase [Puia dinghuensis]|uniref:Probable oxidoreductase n=1 Tax=Puia dinghuensis TaxID=1792502 RepID=A0A8J2XUB0_9BACT|nr:oxidoreductase [Puia dinghuensis]GGB24343.1 oxidoreductase [Puia dinghuensis]